MGGCTISLLKKRTNASGGGPPVCKLVMVQDPPERSFSTNDHRQRPKAAVRPLKGGVCKTGGVTGGRLSFHFQLTRSKLKGEIREIALETTGGASSYVW
jgi:hypothetical protein